MATVAHIWAICLAGPGPCGAPVSGRAAQLLRGERGPGLHARLRGLHQPAGAGPHRHHAHQGEEGGRDRLRDLRAEPLHQWRPVPGVQLAHRIRLPLSPGGWFVSRFKIGNDDILPFPPFSSCCTFFILHHFFTYFMQELDMVKWVWILLFNIESIQPELQSSSISRTEFVGKQNFNYWTSLLLTLLVICFRNFKNMFFSRFSSLLFPFLRMRELTNDWKSSKSRLGLCWEETVGIDVWMDVLQGYSGSNCSKAGDHCRPGVCGTGRCEDTNTGIRCYCPLGEVQHLFIKIL